MLDEPAYGMALPARRAVLYDGDVVVGTGADHVVLRMTPMTANVRRALLRGFRTTHE